MRDSDEVIRVCVFFQLDFKAHNKGNLLPYNGSINGSFEVRFNPVLSLSQDFFMFESLLYFAPSLQEKSSSPFTLDFC